jgi:hypothetical protein
MDQRTIYSILRRLIGGPSPTETSERDLGEYVASASDWLASELKDQFVTDNFLIALVADQSEYPLPPDVGWVLFAEWNSQRLSPSSHFQWDRNGTSYRTAPSGNLSEFAVYGRSMILNPPPSDTAVTTDGYLTTRCITTAREMTAAGLAGFSDFDARLMLYEAAFEYLVNHPSDENNARAQAHLAQINRLLPAARERARTPIEDQRPQFWPQVRRRGAAR